MKSRYLTAALAGTTLLSACGQRTETNAATPDRLATVNLTAADGGDMVAPGEAKRATSTGTVMAIDKVTGKITLAHAAIPEVNWPAMAMAFTAKPTILDAVAVGDKVGFDASIKANAGEVTAVHKQ